MQDIAALATFSKDLGEVADAAIYIKQNVIQWVGPTSSLPQEYASADAIISLKQHVVIPGLVNTHHHMFQCLTRCIAQARPTVYMRDLNHSEMLPPSHSMLVFLEDQSLCSLSLTQYSAARAVYCMQDSKLFGWLTTLYHAWVHLTVSLLAERFKLSNHAMLLQMYRRC